MKRRLLNDYKSIVELQFIIIFQMSTQEETNNQKIEQHTDNPAPLHEERKDHKEKVNIL